MPRGHRYKNARYRAFAEAYLDIGNPETYLKALPSAIKAGWSEGWSRGHSYKLVDKVGIQDEFKRIRDRRRRMSTIASPEEILEALTAVVRTLPNELVDSDGNLVPLNKLTRDQAQLIAGYKTKRRTQHTDDGPVTEDSIEYKLTDRLKAAEMIGRNLGIFEKDNRQQAPNTNLTLVAYPTGDLTLEQWQDQVMAVLAGAGHAQADTKLPALKSAGASAVS